MNLFTSIALVLLTMVGYSIGRNLFTSKYKIAPMVMDLPVILLIWIVAFSIPLALPFSSARGIENATIQISRITGRSITIGAILYLLVKRLRPMEYPTMVKRTSAILVKRFIRYLLA